jgi:hypothetical protein
MPPLVAAPGKTMKLLAPILAIVLLIVFEEPLPISIIAITAATPIIMPNIVRVVRIGLRRMALSAVRSIRIMRNNLIFYFYQSSVIKPSLM